MLDYKGNELASNILGVLYINKYDYKTNTIEVLNVVGFNDEHSTLDAYANTRNPESLMASGKNKEEFEKELTELHKNLNNPKWVESLSECL